MYEPFPARPLSSAEPGGPARRWFLAAGVAALLGVSGGVIAELRTAHRAKTPPPPQPPEALVAAAEAERALIADLDATTGGTPDVRRVIVQARADHAAHLQALVAMLARFGHVPARQRRRPHGTPRTLAQLRAAEQRAATVAGRRASALDGGYAAVLASIAACEATHAELLT